MKVIALILFSIVFHREGVRSQESASYYHGCNETINEGQGMIVSPNYPYPYDSNSLCTWRITVETGRTVRLGFRYFDVENSRNCAYDSVSVYNGPTLQHPQIGKFCGAFRPGNLETTSNKLLLALKTDESGSNVGFIASFVSAIQLLATPGSCGGLMASNTGEFHSLNYPKANYPVGKTCTWHIKAPPNRNVVLSFPKFALEDSNACQYDYVVVYGGRSDVDNIEFIGRYCGTTPPENILHEGNEIFVTFVSDSSGTDVGFEASYSSLEPFDDVDILDEFEPICVETNVMKQKSGSFGSPSYTTQDLEHNELYCSWHLIAPANTQVTLSFTKMNIGYSQNCARSYVIVFDGGSAAGQPLGKFCGNVVGKIVTSSQNQMYVVYHADQENEHFAVNFVSTDKTTTTKSTTTTTTRPHTTTTLPVNILRSSDTTCPTSCPKKTRLASQICKSNTVVVFKFGSARSITSTGISAIVVKSFKGDLSMNEQVTLVMPCKKCRQKVRSKGGVYLYVGNVATGTTSANILPGDLFMRYKSKKHARAVAKAQRKCR